jgi:hypothetical protein
MIPFATFQNSLTNQNLFQSAAICILCFQFAECVFFLQVLKAAGDQLGLIGNQLIMHFLLSKSTVLEKSVGLVG